MRTEITDAELKRVADAIRKRLRPARISVAFEPRTTLGLRRRPPSRETSQRLSKTAPLVDRGLTPFRVPRLGRWAAAGRPAEAVGAGFDPERVILGSFNFSAGAMRNAEDTNLVDAPAVAVYHLDYWRARQKASTPYGQRAQRCHT
jgi:hypothetical protein